MKEANRKISFIITSPSPFTSLTSIINHLYGSGDGDFKKPANQNSRKILGKRRDVNKQNKQLLSAGHCLPKERFSVI